MTLDDWRLELRRTWLTLPAASPVAGQFEAAPMAESPAGPIRVAVDETGQRVLLVPSGSIGGLPSGGPALTIEEKRYTFGTDTRNLLVVGCTDAELFGVFDEFLTSLLDEIAQSEDPALVTLAAVDEWRGLLNARTRESLTVERELGLAAELLVLEILTSDGSFDPGIWRGPLREPKDVVGPDYWVEVKGIGIRQERVTINGIDQLADVEGAAGGYLSVLMLERSDKGRSVSEIVSVLRSRCGDRASFDALLLRSKWSDETPSDRRWSIVDEILVPGAVCPRLTRASLHDPLPVDLLDVRYDLTIRILRAHSVPGPVAELRRLGSGDS